jgi:hypothetical protein
VAQTFLPGGTNAAFDLATFVFLWKIAGFVDYLLIENSGFP